MVYLSGCNFRCRFCIQGPNCFDPERGEPVDADALARELIDAVARGARTIVLVGGEPSLHLPTILELAVAARRAGTSALPLVLKTNMYMTPVVLKLLEGVVQTYVADFKFGSDRCARALAGMDGYLATVTRNLGLVAGRTPLIVRHLLMPGHVECCLKPVAQWVAANLPRDALRLMTGYVPAWRAAADGGELSRTVSAQERRRAEELLVEFKLMEAAR